MMNETYIDNGILRVCAIQKGAELSSIRANGIEYLWQGDERYWKGKAPNLFPYIGRLNQGKYTYHGQEYSMPIHGFAPYSQTYAVSKDSDTQMSYIMRADKNSIEHYPFDFSLSITYEIIKNVLRYSMTVKNCDSKTMYFGLGFHPGFNVPLGGDGSFEDWHLSFSEECSPKRVCFDSDSILVLNEKENYPLQSGKYIALNHHLFDGDAVVLKNTSEFVKLHSDKSSRSVEVRFSQMPYIGFWHTNKSDAPYVCIEPWSSLPSRKDRIEDLEKQENLIRLEPEGEYTNTIELIFT